MAVTRSKNRTNWADLPHELLVYIFAMLNVFDRVTSIGAVCHSWRLAASDKFFSSTLDISECKKHAKPGDRTKIKTQLEIAFVRGINLCGRNLTKLVFDVSFRVSNKHWIYASQRCPNLRELVLPTPESTTKPKLKRAFRSWKNLQNLQIAFRSTLPPVSIFKNAIIHCPNLTVLKVSCCVVKNDHVKAIIKCMPRLKVLSLLCVTVYMEDIIELCCSMPKLEEFYVSILQIYFRGFLWRIRDFPLGNLLASALTGLTSLQTFHFCYWEECSPCMAATIGDIPLNIQNPVLTM